MRLSFTIFLDDRKVYLGIHPIKKKQQKNKQLKNGCFKVVCQRLKIICIERGISSENGFRRPRTWWLYPADTWHLNNVACIDVNTGIKHGFHVSCFHVFTFARSRGRCWNQRPEAEIFSTSLGTSRMLMHLKKQTKKHVRSLLLHKKWKQLLHFALSLELFHFAFSPMFRDRNF